MHTPIVLMVVGIPGYVYEIYTMIIHEGIHAYIYNIDVFDV